VLFPRINVITGEGNLVSNIKFAIYHFFAYVKPYGLIKPGQPYFKNSMTNMSHKYQEQFVKTEIGEQFRRY
jgi:hypothetical protein